ncbi:Man1-Src1p-C-terminal domain-domain-containing protein [Tuber borchii]|uniref:Man1-Src1p-C-terminal domain-domain-containing protein n=1 Tax=Tuber borchii TaxID=42251 RepID=A0A2T6ZN77_TUBBO|nr:Man1-Src1p-C-terminal domain-domain-containing protein [Tuber borchii]
MDEQEYLQPGFDPNTLKVAELRGILLEHSVDYPSSAKKAQLVELFNSQIAPKARRILGARSRVKASVQGIIDMETEGTPLAEATPRRSSRRTTRMGTAETEDEVEDYSRRSPRKRSVSAKRQLNKPARPSEAHTAEPEDQQPPPSTRKTRNSASRQTILPTDGQRDLVLPQIKLSASDDENEASVFSSQNPFQSGSPLARSPDRNDRRKTTGMTSERRRKSGSTRRQTDFPVSYAGDEREDNYTPSSTRVIPASRGFGIPLSRLPTGPSEPPNGVIKKEEVEDDYSLEPGEEFTPEGAAEVAESGPIVHRPRGGVQGAASTSMLWVIVIALLSGYFAWWRKEKLEVGFCGYGKSTTSMHVAENDWTNVLRPQCEPCPPNAICRPDFEATCNDDYVLVPNPLSLGGLIPLAPVCEPDSQKLRKIAILSDEAIRVLRARAADVECGEVALGKDEEAGVSEAYLRQVLYDLKAPSLSDEEFSQLWRNALEDVSNREEVVYHQDSQGQTYLQSTSLVSVPLRCAIRKSISGSMARYRIELSGIMFFIFLAFRLRKSISSNRVYQSQVTKLVHIVLKHLARQAHDHPREPWIAIAHLRDQVLQHEFNTERRRKLWDGVQKIVEMNSNVRAGEREISGEVMRTWTWIGGRIALGGKEEDEGEVVVDFDNDNNVGGGSRGRWAEYPRVIA